MSLLDLTTFGPALKTIYTKKKIENLAMRKHPFLALVQKNTEFYGDSKKVPLIYGNPQGRSATFSTAGTNKTSSKLKAFLLTRVKDYARFAIDNETIRASSNDSGAFLNAATVEMDGAIRALGNSMSWGIFRDGSGNIGTVSASQSGASTTITLAKPEDAMFLEVGQRLENRATAGGSVSGSPKWVIAVDRVVGTFQVAATETGSAQTATASGFTAGVYILIEGDTDAKISGLQAWMPSSVSATPFFGVDRTADRVRLAGIYQDLTAKPIEEAIIEALAVNDRMGGSADKIFLNQTNWTSLEKALGSKVQYVDVKAGYEGTFGFRGIQVNGPNGPVEVLADADNPVGEMFVLQMDTWVLDTLGEAPSLFTGDSLELIRNSTTDTVDGQAFMYGNLECSAPGYNGRFLVA